MLPCFEYELSEDEALQVVIERHRASEGLNDYGRIVLALRLEPYFRERCGRPQAARGKDRPSSNLTNDARRDVRKDIAPPGRRLDRQRDQGQADPGQRDSRSSGNGSCEARSVSTGPGYGARGPRRDSVMPCGTIYIEGPSTRRSTGCSERTLKLVLPPDPSTT